MGEKQQNQKKSFEVIREGFARARFVGALDGAPMPGSTEPFRFAPVEGQENGGLNPDEFTARWFRILSQAVTPYRFFDFTRPGVLKAGVPLFEGITLYANHYADVERWKGFVQEPTWDEKNDPPGINALLVVDRTVALNLARGVEIKALRSCSVTIWFEFERSHPDLKYFYDRLGEEVDGEIVRFIVTKLTRAAEVSIVWEGEDPYAKSFEARPEALGAGHEENHNQGEETDMKLAAATIALLGIPTGTELTQEMLDTKIAETVTGLKNQVEGLKADAALGAQLLTETRERAVTLYKTAKGEKFQQTFVDGVIQKADLATARALVSEYETEVEKSVPLACPKCGEKLSRRSSLETEGQNANSSKRAEDYKL